MDNAIHEPFMQRALDLASIGLGKTAPNPMVGCVIVNNNKIISEGFHAQYGDKHAEVDAISRVKDIEVLKTSTLYVTLEPCNHTGKTPPCTDLIIKHKIPNVIVASVDPNPLVKGSGIKKLKENNVHIVNGILDREAQFLNRRFFTWHQKKRPYIILKWAQSANGYINSIEKGIPKAIRISNDVSQIMSHKWRTQEQAIMIGTNTAIIDNPKLTSRLWYGKNPLRVVIDKKIRIAPDHHLLKDEFPTLVFHSKPDLHKASSLKEFIYISEDENMLFEMMEVLYRREIQSVIIEGGTSLLKSFIDNDLWDEARVFISPNVIQDGLSSPTLKIKATENSVLDTDRLYTYYNINNIYALDRS